MKKINPEELNIEVLIANMIAWHYQVIKNGENVPDQQAQDDADKIISEIVNMDKEVVIASALSGVMNDNDNAVFERMGGEPWLVSLMKWVETQKELPQDYIASAIARTIPPLEEYRQVYTLAITSAIMHLIIVNILE